MFDQLLDPEPPAFGPAFRRRVIANGRRHRRRVRAATGGAVLMPFVAVAGLGIYLRSQADELERVSVGGLVPAEAPAVADPIEASVVPMTSPDEEAPPPISVPVNVLVAGIDQRPPGSDVEGSRADVIALVRIDPSIDRVSILSLPRDLLVTNADGRSGRLSSFSENGSLVGVVSSLLDLDVNHYVEIDFDGFVSIIDIIGGVTVPFDQPVRDMATGFHADAGCNQLSGSDALSYVRSRKLETLDPATDAWTMDQTSDVGRIARQQGLIQRVYRAVLSEDYSTRDQVRILNDVVDDLTVDDGLDLDGVRAIFNAAAAIGSNGFVAYGVADVVTPELFDGAGVLIADPAEITAIADAFLGRNPDAIDPTSSGTHASEPSDATC